MDFQTIAEPREKILALIVILGILVSFLRAVYIPMRQEQTQLSTRIRNLELEKGSLEKFTQALLKQMPEEKGEVLSPQLKILKGEMAPYAKETSILLSQLSASEFLKGLAVKKMSDLPPEKKEGYLLSHFSLNTQGPFQTIFDFLERVEKFPALMTTDNLTLKVLDTKAAQVELELNGTLFHLEKEEK